ncbi:hypothetical protein YSA_02139 [Pseudomonas putida ND6]|uniref:Uncharacterized protein n=1 Tax=Pseudomonas putida ND6 TaxID=231023 RepID=I3UR08_PSEPU|nr:hypothetical protein YSA_02139 [Pseudomonas putida ND6]
MQSDGSFSVSSTLACIMDLNARGNNQAMAFTSWLHLPQRGSAAKLMRLIILPIIPFLTAPSVGTAYDEGLLISL